MEHYFELPVSYKGEELTFKGRLVTFAYEYKFYVNVAGQELIFEKDDEQNFRAITMPDHAGITIDPALVEKIIEVLRSL